MVTFKPVALLTQAIAELIQMATIGFLFNPILSTECEGSVTQSRTASNSLGAPEDTQISFNFVY